MKVALVHDWLTGRRGGEKVLEALAEIFPQAPIYTLFHFSGSQIMEIEKRKIYTSFLQKAPFLHRYYRFYLPLFPLAIELFNLQEYDLVISSSHCVAKGIIPRPGALHIAYIHSPMRYAWNQYYAYFSSQRLSLFKRFLIPPQIHYLRLWDVSSSARVDYFIANSVNVAKRIERYYRRPAEVIYPPVDTDFFVPSKTDSRDDYFLIVSALVPYKKIELAIEAFNRLNKPLLVIGQGPEEKRLKKLASSNIRFLKNLSDEELRSFYQRARGFILPGEEDFGIATVEAQACGTPVVAFGRGGSLETVLPEITGLLFEEPTVEALLETLDKFSRLPFNRTAIRQQAEKFSRSAFRNKMINFLNQVWKKGGGQV
ncbi:MAG: glycosyltransferase [Candidatus Aminicenantes bacterium]|nr:glycosyltransferase [Candidatus Aminicenantes bacterium]